MNRDQAFPPAGGRFAAPSTAGPLGGERSEPRAPASQPTRDDIAAFALRVWQYKQGEMVALMIHLGDRLGLYKAMAGAGQLRASELAERTGLHERWLLEWLRSQAAAGLLDTADGETFELPAEGVEVLADEEGSLWFAAGAFSGSSAPPDVVERLAMAFRTGIGLSYDDLGPSAAHQVERMLGPWSRLALVERIIPALDGVRERLQAGGRVADVGCGAGVATLALAQAFPRSSFEGFDVSRHAVERARQKAAEWGVPNARFEVRAAEDLAPAQGPPAQGQPGISAGAPPGGEGGAYHLVLTLDCLHDMARPDRAIAAIRRAIAPDGVWLIKDIKCSPRWQDNLRNPLLAMMYSTSVATCMSSAMSEVGGAGLGTLGFDSETAERMCRQAGFSRFIVRDFDDPANLYYEVRP